MNMCKDCPNIQLTLDFQRLIFAPEKRIGEERAMFRRFALGFVVILAFK